MNLSDAKRLVAILRDAADAIELLTNRLEPAQCIPRPLRSSFKLDDSLAMLSVRSKKICERMGVSTLRELASKTKQEVSAEWNCGEFALGELEQVLTDNGLNFKETER